ILIGNDLKNAEAAYAALKSFGAPVRTMKASDLLAVDAFFRMRTPPVMVDILSAAMGVDFEAAWNRREVMTVDEKTGLTAFVISAEDLIVSKKASGRPQDLADVSALENVSKGT